MIWNDRMIREWASNGGIDPYDPACINPASIDLRWSGKWKVCLPVGDGIWSEEHESDTLELLPGTLYLLDSLEFVTMPENAGGFLALKSSTGRKGIEHLHAGWFDPGFQGTATWEIHCLWSMGQRIRREQRLMQLVLEECHVPERSYAVTGRYNGQRGPTTAR